LEKGMVFSRAKAEPNPPNDPKTPKPHDRHGQADIHPQQKQNDEHHNSKDS
jgi:hypothetical protein